MLHLLFMQSGFHIGNEWNTAYDRPTKYSQGFLVTAIEHEHEHVMPPMCREYEEIRSVVKVCIDSG